ncbi:GNAT family N-acetyltransferase [Reinekea blandensis]|nr:GNAT family N-acetyltransferase [Reinekea blandensis]
MRPTLTTPRLVLRPYRLSDAPRVQQLAGDKIIADMTANIPHPYRDGMAEAWIEQHDAWFQAGSTISLAITLNTQDAIIGTVSLSQIHQGCGNLGYWLGVPFWGQGIATEAAREMVRYGFEEFGLTTIVAQHLQANPRSGRVIEKCGLTYQNTDTVNGRLVKHYVGYASSETRAVTP